MRKTILFNLMMSLAVVVFFTACGDDDSGGGGVAPTQITAFAFNSPVVATGTIDQTALTVAINVPFGTDLSNVFGTVTVSDGATITPDITAGVDFSSLSVQFTVTNGTETSVYTVNVTVAPNPLRLALVGDGELANQPAEIQAAYDWAETNWGNQADYFDLNTMTAEDIETAKVVWFHWTTFPRPDVEGGADLFPASALGAASTIEDYYKAGGNLLLSGITGSYLAEVNRIPADQGPTNLDIGGDEFIENPDNWGISYIPGVFNADDYPTGNDSYYLFDGVTTSSVTFEGETYDAIFLSAAGAKKNRAHIWDFNRFHPELDDGCTAPNARKSAWEATNTAKVRASFEWDPAACGVELGAIVEFEPTATYLGTAIVIGLGAYEWDREDKDTNANAEEWLVNVEAITFNAIDNFVNN